MPKVAYGMEWYARRGTTPRKGWIEDGVGYLPLTKGKVALLDPAALVEAEKFNWTFSHGYAVRTQNKRHLYLHHFLMNLADANVADSHVDHINGNALDNRFSNIRQVARWQNQVNRGLQSNNTTGYRGVTATRGKWSAWIKRQNITTHLGTYDTPEAAAAAYDDAALRYSKRFVRLNLTREPDDNS